MLKYNGTTKPSVKILTNSIPSVYFARSVIDKMECYIEGCSMEIGWLCAATRDKSGDVFIYDAFLFKQQVHSTTTEITPEGLSDFATELLTLPNGIELWNDMRAWGHSHVNMACFPSGQDDKQMQDFKATGFDWFVRIIGNKKGEMRVDLYDYANRLEYMHLEWHVLESEAESEVEARLEALNAEYEAKFNALELEKKAIVEMGKREIKPAIDAEIKEKVSTITFNRTYASQGTYHPSAGYRNNGQQYMEWDDAKGRLAPVTVENGVKVRDVTHIDSVKKNENNETSAKQNEQMEDVGGEDNFDVYGMKDLGYFKEPNTSTDFYKFFAWADLVDIARCEDTNELDEWLFENYGSQCVFSDAETLRLLNYAKSYQNNWR